MVSRLRCVLMAALLLSLAGSALGQPGVGSWWSETIGTTTIGNATIKGDTYTVTGNGVDIWGTADGFHYLYKQLTGDGSMTARVVSIGPGSNTWAKGGVMIRANNSAGSADAYMILSANTDGAAGNGAGFQWRLSQGASAAWDGAGPTTAVAPPYWVRVERVGNAFAGYLSADGKTWAKQGTTQTITMPNPVLIGLCVTSHAAGELRTIVFDSVSYTGNVTDRPPQVKALNPSPASGATGVSMPLFQWSAGETGIFHNVYFGTSPDLTEANLVAARQPFTMYYHMAPLTPGTVYYWRVDEVEADMTTVHKGDVWSFSVAPLTAYGPIPANGALYQNPDVDLAWTAGQGAVGHELYFGTDKSAVSAGSASVSKGKLVAPTFDPGKLALETTYYWRVDEIDTSGKKHIGEVWSFTSTIPGLGAAKRELWNNITGTAVNLLTGDPRFPGSPDVSDTVPNFESPAGIGDNYGGKLSAWLHVPTTGDYTFWLASDDYGELRLGPDPDSATLIANVPGWSNAQEWDKYPAQKSAPIHLEAGRYYLEALWKEGGGGDNCAVGWQGPGIPQRVVIAGSYLMPFEALWACGPRPVHGAKDVTQTPELRWTAGTKAKQHDVYFGEDAQAVATATTSSSLYKGRQNANTFNPGELEWNKTYYWRVDEINTAEAGSPWKGTVWSFTTASFLVVDDMESYTDDEGNRIYEFWIDGWTNGTGSTVGNLQAPFAERTIVHAGRQAMPLDYNNTKSPFYSEAELTFAPLQNWTVNGVTDLSLWFRGRPVSYVDQGNGAFTVSGSGHDIWDNADDFRFVYKRLNGDGSITVKVDSLVNTNAWAKAGVMIRETLEAGSKHAAAVITPANGMSFPYRNVSNGASIQTNQTGLAVPFWLRITRTGSVFKAERSPDGKTWTMQGTEQTIAMATGVYIGLCVTSHDRALTTTAEFSNTATTGNVTGAWQQVWIGADPDLTNGAAGLYLAVEDSTGKSVVMTHPDPTAATLGAWTEWKVPLSSLTGVNLARVKKLYLGVGDKKAPVPGGAGRVYLDDIRVIKP